MIAFRPKMTRLDKKKLAVINQNKRSAKRIRNKLATTLNWMDVKKVTEDTLILEKNKEVVYVQGIKLTPHNIFIDEMIEQEQWIDNIRLSEPNGYRTILWLCIFSSQCRWSHQSIVRSFRK